MNIFNSLKFVIVTNGYNLKYSGGTMRFLLRMYLYDFDGFVTFSIFDKWIRIGYDVG